MPMNRSKTLHILQCIKLWNQMHDNNDHMSYFYQIILQVNDTAEATTCTIGAVSELLVKLEEVSFTISGTLVVTTPNCDRNVVFTGPLTPATCTFCVVTIDAGRAKSLTIIGMVWPRGGRALAPVRSVP